MPMGSEFVEDKNALQIGTRSVLALYIVIANIEKGCLQLLNTHPEVPKLLNPKKQLTRP